MRTPEMVRRWLCGHGPGLFVCWTRVQTSDRWSVSYKWSTPTSWWRSSARQDRLIPVLYDLYDLYDLAHVAGWDEPYNLHDLGHVSWVGSVLYRSCSTCCDGRLGYGWSKSWSVWSVRGMRTLHVNPWTVQVVYLSMATFQAWYTYVR